MKTVFLLENSEMYERTYLIGIYADRAKAERKKKRLEKQQKAYMDWLNNEEGDENNPPACSYSSGQFDISEVKVIL